ncbi:MAG TPA: glycine--tRNA ligase subunit beta [Chloroflexi bacterium]|nr:glycine--tRNA ligase subunit beta [Chloroflexota bacterium]
MSEALNFQEIILNLQRYWADQGCLIWQPYHTEVGAGTNNPATILRVLGPEPWRVGYVEPSIRPDDARYGENPYRLAQHTQFQVILKPDPGNPQELYLNSLRSIGIDPDQHDIRFVEDNWESPALGAWGLGWEVWLDGQEITQFTYFQQAGGQVLEPVSVEITYGLERIAMALQQVRIFKEIRWDDRRTYGDVQLQSEQENSKYYFETADVDRLRTLYQIYHAEAVAALEHGLVYPALDYILKSSHTFNLLDTRGAVGVTERQAMFAAMRDLTRRMAALYVEQRQQLEFPWLDDHQTAQAAPARPALKPAAGDRPADFLLEIGTEELPAGDLSAALQQLNERVPQLLDELRLAHGEIRVMGTPRRLVVSVSQLAERQPDRETVVKGPPAQRAFDASGAPTKAAEGFARSRGLSVEDLKVEELDGGKYVTARVFEPGRPAVEILAEALPGLIAGLRFERAMRWNATGVAFSRPIRWLLALLGEQVIPFEYAGLQSGGATRGLRFHDPEWLETPNPQAYFDALAAQGIVLDPAGRSAEIARQVRELIQSAGGDPERLDTRLLEEVTQLVEAPTAVLGSFDREHLELPEQVLVTVMKKHQRYFPVYAPDGKLLPHFVTIRNGGRQYLDTVREGNEIVIRARFADAAFFISEDLKKPLEEYLPRLSTLTFQTKLGSMLDKQRRVEELLEDLLMMVPLQEDDAEVARRAAKLCKADLVTHMVIEMTGLQGIMGRHYALKSGEDPAVAETLFEYLLPRFAGDALPAKPPALMLGIADRVDSLVGLFAAGLAPSGTKDPFALRRTALGLIQLLTHWELPLDLRAAAAAAARFQPIEVTEDHLKATLDFIAGRLQNFLLEEGYRHDVVSAVLAEQGADPASARLAVKELSEWVKDPQWPTLLPAYARCVRITRDQPEIYPVDPGLFETEAERSLWEAVSEAEKIPRRAGSVQMFFKLFGYLVPEINRFFDDVLVMAEDEQVRRNRLGILQRIAAMTAGMADLSRLEGF